MKQSRVLCVLGLTAVLLGGCARQQSKVEYIGAQRARELALEASGLTASDVTFSETDLSSRNDKDYYQVSFTASGADYQYDIDALTGIVIESRLPSDTQTNPDNAAGSDVRLKTAPESTAKLLTAEEAAKKALAHAGITESQATIVKNQLEYEDGRQVYDVEFYSKDYEEYDYEVDAVTGEIVSFDYDAENITPPESAGAGMISEDEAKKLALDRVPGAGSGDIWEFEVDKDDGHIEYEGKILYGGMEYEFEIDAYSGTFRSWEAEPAD